MICPRCGNAELSHIHGVCTAADSRDETIAHRTAERDRLKAELQAAEAERDGLREALRKIVGVANDREAFVALGPSGFAWAAEVARKALAPPAQVEVGDAGITNSQRGSPFPGPVAAPSAGVSGTNRGNPASPQSTPALSGERPDSHTGEMSGSGKPVTAGENPAAGKCGSCQGTGLRGFGVPGFGSCPACAVTGRWEVGRDG